MNTLAQLRTASILKSLKESGLTNRDIIQLITARPAATPPSNTA